MIRQPCTKAWCEPDHTRAGRCWRNHDDHASFYWGRCRSGKRWFWRVFKFGRAKDGEDYNGGEWYGWEGTDAGARQAAIDKVRANAGGRPVYLGTHHSDAQRKLQEVNRERLKEKLASNPSAAKGGTVVEYIYTGGWSDANDHDGSHWGIPIEWVVCRFRITKKTPKRIYYINKGERIDPGAPEAARFNIHDFDTQLENVRYIDRQAMDASGDEGLWTGRRWWSGCHFYLEPPPKPVERTASGDVANADTLKKLKEEMAAAHPDKGGSNEAFHAARQRYVEVRRRTRGAEGKAA